MCGCWLQEEVEDFLDSVRQVKSRFSHLFWGGKISVARDGRKMFVDILDLEKFVESNKTTYL
jgi:hypothetical protein